MNTRNSTARTVALVIGSLAVLFGVCLGVGAGTLVWAHNTQRDSAGFYTTSAERLATETYALKSDQIDLGVDAASYRWVPGDEPTVVRLEATATGDHPVFVGIAPSADVDRYLAGTAFAEVTDFEVGPFRPDLEASNGSARPALPGDQGFWAASAQGGGSQTVDWNVQSGSWTVVVMNADSTPGVAVDVAVGAKTGILLPIGIGMAVVAILMVGGGIALAVLGSRGSRSLPLLPDPARPVATRV